MDYKAMQQLEWEDWQNVVAELKKLGIDINTTKSLTNKLLSWADSRHQLKTLHDKLYPVNG
jgi:hypothetical protein